MDEFLMKQGAFSWVELLTSDLAGAKKFYRDLFGWQLDRMTMEGSNEEYTILKIGDRQIGGMMGMRPEDNFPPHWGVYVTVDDVDRMADRAKTLGAQILVPPMDIPNVGRFSVLQDPQGAVISVITYKRQS